MLFYLKIICGSVKPSTSVFGWTEMLT